MKIFSRIGRGIWLIGTLLVALLIVPPVHGQDTSDQILYAVGNESGDNTIYTVNVNNGGKDQIGVVHKFGSEAGWSPDGKFIYLFDNNDPNQPTLTLVDVETKHRQTIPDRLEPSPCSLPFWWSPNGEWLAYSAQSASQLLLKIINTRNADIQTLSDAALPYGEVSWSSDGHYLAYRTVSRSKSDTVLIWNVQKQRTVSVLDVPSSSEFPQWSPTENRIAFAAADSSIAVIYNLANGTKQQYTGDRIGNWSPDGHFLTIYHQDKNDHTLLSVIDVFANITVEFDGEIGKTDVDANATWSSDGRYLAMATLDVDNGYKATIYIMDVVKRSSQRLKIDPLDYGLMTWSPRGHSLAFASGADEFVGYVGFTSLWLFDVDHQDTFQFSIKIPLRAYVQALNWSSTGLYMTVFADTSVALMDWKALQLKLLGDASHTFAQPYWSPDGTKLALYSGEANDKDIYVLTPDGNSLNDMIPKNITNTPREEETFLGWQGSKISENLTFCGEG